MVVKWVLLTLLFTGCSVVHERGNLPKVKFDTEYADDCDVKIHKDEILATCEWYF